MNRSDLVIRLSMLSGMSLRQTEESVDLIISTMSDTLATGQRIEIRGFGTLDLSHRPARIARNPRTGETFPVAGKYFPTFKAGKLLRETLSRRTGYDANQEVTLDTGTLHIEKRMLASKKVRSVTQETSV